MSRPAEPAGLTRAGLAERTLLTLHRGEGSSPDVLLVETDGGRAVVKDYIRRGPLVRRLLAPWLVAREMRAYAALESHPNVPPLLGRLDALAFAVEHRGGPRFSRRRPWTFGSGFGQELARAVDAMHARGVLHLDLSHRSNLRADLLGRPVLIDFGSAVVLPSRGRLARAAIRLLGRIDRRAVRKWRERLGPPGPLHSGAGAGAGAVSKGAARGARRPM